MGFVFSVKSRGAHELCEVGLAQEGWAWGYHRIAITAQHTDFHWDPDKGFSIFKQTILGFNPLPAQVFAAHGLLSPWLHCFPSYSQPEK